MSLYISESGPKTAPAIVFLHGGGGASWMWQPQVEHLPDYHCVVPDLPEHGRSRDVELKSVPAAAALIVDLIREHTASGKAHVVGLSLGAQVLTALLATAPEVVDHAIISSALVRPLPGAWMYTPAVLEWAFRLTVSPFKGIDAWARINMKYSAGIPEQYFAQFRQDFRAMTAATFSNITAANQSFRLLSGLERVTAPVLVVVGKGELPAMQDSTRDLVKAIPHAQGRMVVHDKKYSTAQEHNWSMNEPELFTAMVRAWIEDRALPTALQPFK